METKTHLPLLPSSAGGKLGGDSENGDCAELLVAANGGCARGNGLALLRSMPQPSTWHLGVGTIGRGRAQEARRGWLGRLERRVARERMGHHYGGFICGSRGSHNQESVLCMGLLLETFLQCYSRVWDPILRFGISIGDSLTSAWQTLRYTSHSPPAIVSYMQECTNSLYIWLLMWWI
jgi:hypothetical protein